LCAQVVQPNPGNKQAYADALVRHVQLGKQLFADKA
jgi:hypothetical protein